VFQLEDERVAVLREPAADAPGGKWGLGWALADGLVSHTGSWGGFRSLLVLDPGRREAGVALAASARAGAAVRRLAYAALGREPETPHVVELPPERLAELAGVYRSAEGEETRVSVAGSALRLELAPYPPDLAWPVSETELAILDGEDAGHRIDFPLPGWARIGWRLAEKVA
jgi:hypothetical protein